MNSLDNSSGFEYPDMLMYESTLDRRVMWFIVENPGSKFSEFLVNIIAEASTLFDAVQNRNISDATTNHELYGFAVKSVADLDEKTCYLNTIKEYAKLSWERVTRFRANTDTDTISNISVGINSGRVPRQLEEIRRKVNAWNNQTV